MSRRYCRWPGCLPSDAEPEPDAAAALCRQAAELGDGEAQYQLAQFYLAGIGVPADPTEAARWMSKAADQGVSAAYERLGALYAEGLGMPQDFQAAADWFHRAVVQGDVNALYHLGTLQMGGLGMPRDPRAAREQYRKAAKLGSGAACLQLGIIYATGQDVKPNLHCRGPLVCAGRRARSGGGPLQPGFPAPYGVWGYNKTRSSACSYWRRPREAAW